MKIFADGANTKSILELAENPNIKGFTTNPTLMRVAGIVDYEGFARNIIKELYKRRPDVSISLEVFSDDFDEMYKQAQKIYGWSEFYGQNVYVKIPIMNTRGHDSLDLIKSLAHDHIKVNVTAVFTIPQVASVLDVLSKKTPAIISIFAGRIADTNEDPEPIFRNCKAILKDNVELLWASCREPLNFTHALRAGADIITIPPDILKKLFLLKSKDLVEYSKETVKMFRDAAVESGYQI